MTWILVAYLLVLAFLTVNTGKLSNIHSLRSAWRWLAMVAISHVLFALFRVENFRDASDMARIELWADGFQWLFLGISLFCLSGVVPVIGGNAKP